MTTTLPAATAECRSCHAAIRWAQNETTGKLAPLDAEPSEDGNCHLFYRRGRAVFVVLGTAEQRATALGRGTPLFTNHFVTCPQREEWKR